MEVSRPWEIESKKKMECYEWANMQQRDQGAHI